MAARSGGFGGGVEWSGLVVGGGQISDIEQEGEEELREKREKRGRQWGGAIWAGLGLAGRRNLGWPWLG